MKVEIKKIDTLKRSVTIEVQEERLRREKESIYRELSKSLKVPGFRPGTAPLDLLERHHKKTLQDEFLKRVIPLFYKNAIEETNLEPVSLPRISNLEITDKRLKFIAEFEVRPTIELHEEDFKGIRIKVKRANVEEIEIEKFITQLKEEIGKAVNRDFTDIQIAQWVGYGSVEEFKEAIKTEIMVSKLRNRRIEIEKNVKEILLNKIKITVPQGLVKEHLKKLVQQEMYTLKTKGLKEEEIKKYEEEITAKYKDVAQENVKFYYVLDAIAQKEGIKVEGDTTYSTVIGYILSNAQFA